MSFYMGSFAEVLATTRELGRSSREGTGDAIWSDVLRIGEAKALAESSASELGLPVSERNAYSVLGGEIPSLEPVYLMAGPAQDLCGAEDAPESRRQAPRGSARKPQQARNPLKRLGKADMAEIAEGAGQVVARVVGRYFLKTAPNPGFGAAGAR